MKLQGYSLAPYRLRLLFRGAFLLLAIATVALALYVLREEQALSYRNYLEVFGKNEAQIAARLRHPTGQLALLNAPRDAAAGVTPLRPLLLPFAALDFDDPDKVRQGIEMAGCTVQYPDGSSLCAAIGNNPWAGGFVYLAGSFKLGKLVEHRHGERDLYRSHRLRVIVETPEQRYAWIAPFESLGDSTLGLRGRLTGFIDSGNPLPPRARPVRDFRGWLWQAPQCIQPDEDAQTCMRPAFLSVRLPVEVLRAALFAKQPLIWPPADLAALRVHLQFLAPGDSAAPLLDSDAAGAVAPFALDDLTPLLLPGESLRIRKLDATTATAAVHLVGNGGPQHQHPAWLERLIGAVVATPPTAAIERRDIIATPLGNYELRLTGDARSVNDSLLAVATRISWFVGAMLLAILLAWLAIEVSIIRRINELRRRASKVSRLVNATDGLDEFDLADLRGADELGVLAACLADLLRRVREDVEREHIRAEQEKELWHAVGHEIMSPLQSLLALHGDEDHPSRRYIARMQQAVQVLYGSASPSEAFQSTTLQLVALDLDAFLNDVAQNAPCIGIADVEFHGTGAPVLVRADEHSLEDVVAHVLNNAARHRRPGTVIDIRLEASATAASVALSNRGASIPSALLERIFEYGVSGDTEGGGRRGQGLFVAKTYMAKMGGTVSAHNLSDGVAFVLSLPRAPLSA